MPLVLVAGTVLRPGLVPGALPRLIAALVAAGVVLVAARRPDRCLVLLLALMPYQLFVPAWLHAQGVPAAVLRPLTAWREVLGLAIVVAAVRAARRAGRRIDALDLLAMAYVTLASAYALVPTLFVDGAPLDSDVRWLGWRSLATFVLLLIACRHADLGLRAREAADRALRWTAVVVALLAAWEFADDEGWNRFAVETVQVTRYQAEILDVPSATPDDVRVYGSVGGREIVRVSSVLGSPLSLGHFLVVPFGLALERAARGRTRGAFAAAGLIGAAILFTQTRSAMVGAVVVLAAAVRRAPGRSSAARTRFWLLLVAAGIAAAPFVASAGLTDRFGDESSNEAHREGFWDGLATVAEHPLGEGVGTSAGIGQRFGTATTVSENYYLQVGNELGVLGAALFVALVALVNRELRRARDRTGDAVTSGARSGFLGVSVAAFFLHSYANQAIAWTAFGVAGAGLATATEVPPSSIIGEARGRARPRREDR